MLETCLWRQREQLGHYGAASSSQRRLPLDWFLAHRQVLDVEDITRPLIRQECQSCLVHLRRHILLLFDRAELREQGEEIGQITGFRDLSIAESIKADSANHRLLLCR